MKLNIQKCNIMHIGKRNPKANYTMEDYDSTSRINISTTECERDLGVLLSSDLKPSAQCNKVASKANSLLGLFKNSFVTRDAKTWSMIYKTYIRPQIEFANSAWFPYRSKDIEILEKVQRRATRIVQNLKGRPYLERYKCLGLTSLVERRARGDMIQRFKITKELDEISWYVTPAVSNPRGGHRGHMRREIVRACDQRHYFFNNRIANLWNSLPDEVVNSTSVNSFKKKLDEHWSTAIGRHQLLARSACVWHAAVYYITYYY